MTTAVDVSEDDLESKDDNTLLSEARWHIGQSHEAQRRSLWHAVECGRRIRVVHDRLARRRGRPLTDDEDHDWAGVVARELGVGQRHAYNLMTLASPETIDLVLALPPDTSLRTVLGLIGGQPRGEPITRRSGGGQRSIQHTDIDMLVAALERLFDDDPKEAAYQMAYRRTRCSRGDFYEAWDAAIDAALAIVEGYGR